MKVLMAAIAAVLSMTIMSPVQASPLEHIERKGNVIKVDVVSGADYYQTVTRYRSGKERVRIESDYVLVDPDTKTLTLKVKNLCGKWKVRVSVIRGYYGSTTMVVKRYHYKQS